MRLVTRADFDGLICAVLLSQVETVDDYELVHPKDIHDDLVPISSNDIIANLPYHSNAGMWFDHHSSEMVKANTTEFKGSFDLAPSCASVIYEYYSQFDSLKSYEPIVIEADKIDAARFTMEDVRNPKEWVLLSKTMHIYDREKRFEDTRAYFLRLLTQVGEQPLAAILADDEVKNRIAFLQAEHETYLGAVKRHSRTDANLIITDFREVEYVPNGDKFLVYTLFPEQNVSMNVFNKRKTDFTVISCGYSIFNRTCEAHIGELMQQYGGGGHRAAGSCRVNQSDADFIMTEIKNSLKECNVETHHDASLQKYIEIENPVNPV